MPCAARTVRCATGTGSSPSTRSKRKARASSRQQQHPLDHGKARPGADPGPRRKRHIGLAGAGTVFFGLPTVGSNSSGAVQMRSWRCRCQGLSTICAPLATLPAPHLLGAAVLAHHHRHRRIKPQHLAEHVAGVAQLGDRTELRGFAQGLRLCRDLLLHLGIKCQQINSAQASAEAEVSCPARKKIAT